MRKLIIFLLVLLALIYFAADMMAQQKFSLFDRAVAEGGGVVATNGSVLMVGSSGAILGKVWTGGDLGKALFVDGSGLLYPHPYFFYDSARAHYTFKFRDDTTDSKAMVAFRRGVATGYTFQNHLCFGDCDNETAQGPWSFGLAGGMTNPTPYLHPYNITYPTAAPADWNFAFTYDATLIVMGRSNFSSGATGCAAHTRGFCVEDSGQTRKARYGMFQDRIIMRGYEYRWPSAPPTEQGQTLTSPAAGSCPSDGSSVCNLVWGTPTLGTVTNVGLALPTNEFTVTNSPVTSTGTLTGSWKVQNANKVFAGPTTGADATPGFRALAPADYPVFVGSGASHAVGAVPDPGASAGTTHYLREDGSWIVPAGSDPTTTKGDLFTRDASSAARLAVGADGTYLKADSSQSTGQIWAAATFTSPLTTKGDLFGRTTVDARVPVGADGKVLVADSAATPGVSYQGGWVQIAKITTAASQATVDFTSIPATYTDLMVTYTARDNYVGSTEAMFLKVNNDGTAANYSASSYILYSGTGSISVGNVVASTSGMFINNLPGTTATANIATSGKTLIPNYLQTTFYKKVFTEGNYSQSGADSVQITDGAAWKSTAAITRLTFIVATSFVNGSVFTLYGMGTP